jgi:hypothetical protein
MLAELTPVTAAGVRLVEIAERAAGLADEAAVVDALQRAGYATAPVPVALGGMGVSSLQDLAAAQSRLARSHPSVAESFAVHFAAVVAAAQRHEAALAAGTARRAGHCARLLERIARIGELVTRARESDEAEMAVASFLRAAAALGAAPQRALPCAAPSAGA